MSEARQPERLGKICYIKARIGWRGLSSAEYTEEGPFLIAGQHVRNGVIAWDKCDHISEQRYLESHEIILRSGDVIITKDGTIGRVARVDELPGAATINGTMMLVRPLRRLDYRYLYHVLCGRGFQKLIDDKVSGSSIPHLFQRDMVELEVDLPPLDYQSKIAEILDALDAAIRGTEAVVAKLKAMKLGLLHDLLTRGIDVNGDLRPPQSEAPDLYKQTPIGWLPKEWDVGKVSDQFDIQLGKMLDSQKNRGAKKTYLGNKAIQWDKIDLTEAQTVRMSLSDLVKFRLQPGDLLLCEGGDVGRCAIWSGELEECYYQKALHRLRPTRGYSSRLMVELMRWYVEGDLLSEYVSKTSIAHLTQEKLATVPLLIPPIGEQKKIEDQIIHVRDRIQSEERLLGKLRLQKSGLMDDLLTGRVPVTPLL
jgi:type I restriction enzyme, S subunit